MKLKIISDELTSTENTLTPTTKSRDSGSRYELFLAAGILIILIIIIIIILIISLQCQLWKLTSQIGKLTANHHCNCHLNSSKGRSLSQFDAVEATERVSNYRTNQVETTFSPPSNSETTFTPSSVSKWNECIPNFHKPVFLDAPPNTRQSYMLYVKPTANNV